MARLHLVIAFLACPMAAAMANEIPIVREEVSIPPGGTRGFEFGTVPQRDTTVLLEIVARLHTERPSGSNFFLRLALNGRPIQPARARGVMRLVNRPLVSPVAPDLPSSWFGGGAFRLLYAPDFQCGRRASFYVGDPYLTVLDVTDLTNPAAENRLEIANTARAQSLHLKPGEGGLVIGRLVIRTKPEPSPTMAALPAAAPRINAGQPAAGPAKYRGDLLPGGGFRLTVDKRRWEFVSDFSYPNAGLNRLAATAEPDAQGQPGWRPRVEAADDGGTVVAQGADYALHRAVRFTGRKVDVADRLTNLHRDRALGLMVRHQVGLAEWKDPMIRLAGNPDPAVDDYYSAHNPSVHIAAADQGLGLLCEDDVLRNQARLFYADHPRAAGLRTEMLRLGPGETYTLRWSAWPVAGPDYYDFVNLVREDWGANVTVDGAWTFFSPDTILATPLERIRQQFDRLGIRYACYCGGWVDPKADRKRIGFGTGVLDDYWSDFRRRLREAAARIRQAAPGVKVLVYYDTQRDTSEGGHERFRDSWLTDRHGNQVSTNWGGQYSLTWSVVATLQNSFGKAMLATADRYLEEMQVDGLYWDEMEAVAYGMPLMTFNQPDGHSCLLHPKRYTIEREVGITTLLGEAHRLAVIERVRKRGGTLMGNGPACTRAILATGVPRMVEIQHNDSWCYEGNLGTPLGYMSSRTDFGNLTRALRMPVLPVGTRYDYTYDTSRWLFPSTPIELHHGYLLAKERIVATHSGSYGWPGQRCLVEIRRFSREGKSIDAYWPTVIRHEARTAVQLGDEEAAVLERLPVRVEPCAGPVTVSQVRYGADALGLRIDALQGATLSIQNGRFAVHDGRRYAVRIGEEEPQPTTAGQGSLVVKIKPVKNALLRIAAE